jgi:hypothetical protein
MVLVALLLAACADAGGSGPADTEFQVLDRSGEPLLGTINLWSRGDKDNCTIYGSSCTVSLPTGDYSVTFHKEPAGRVSGSVGGQVQDTKASSCLRARVHVVPGQKVVCKKTGEFTCAQGAYGNLDCGESDSARYGFKPTPQDEPPEDATAAVK